MLACGNGSALLRSQAQQTVQLRPCGAPVHWLGGVQVQGVGLLIQGERVDMRQLMHQYGLSCFGGIIAVCLTLAHTLAQHLAAGGPLAPASYVIVREVPATDWGYAGQTQAARRLRAAAL